MESVPLEGCEEIFTNVSFTQGPYWFYWKSSGQQMVLMQTSSSRLLLMPSIKADVAKMMGVLYQACRSSGGFVVKTTKIGECAAFSSVWEYNPVGPHVVHIWGNLLPYEWPISNHHPQSSSLTVVGNILSSHHRRLMAEFCGDCVSAPTHQPSRFLSLLCAWGSHHLDSKSRRSSSSHRQRELRLIFENVCPNSSLNR